MNKQLEELAQPVAWKLHHHDRYYFEENADVVAIAEIMGKAKGDAVYSQEYVNALLAELESAQQRIAELESCSRLEYTRRIEQENAELKAKLATPVQPPDDGRDDCIDMWPGHCADDFDTGYKFGLWRYEQNIRDAGFKVEGQS